MKIAWNRMQLHLVQINLASCTRKMHRFDAEIQKFVVFFVQSGKKTSGWVLCELNAGNEIYNDNKGVMLTTKNNGPIQQPQKTHKNNIKLSTALCFFFFFIFSFTVLTIWSSLQTYNGIVSNWNVNTQATKCCCTQNIKRFWRKKQNT